MSYHDLRRPSKRLLPTLFTMLVFLTTPVSVAAVQERDASPQTSRNPVRAVGNGLQSLASDAWATVSWPAHMDRDDAWKVGGTLAVGAVLFAFDQEITDWIHRNEQGAVLDPIGQTGEFLEPMGLMGKTNPYWLAGMTIGWATRQGRMERIFQELLFSNWIASALRNAGELVVGRRRPDEGITREDGSFEPYGPYQFDAGGGTSLPSGHTSTVFQVAAVLSHHIDRWPASVALYGLATTVAYQRIQSDKHWASDVWLGGAVGWGVAQVVIQRHESDSGAGRVSVFPLIEPGGRAGVRVTKIF